MPRWEYLLAIIGGAVAFWGQVKAFIAWVRSWVIVTKKHEHSAGLLVLSYLEATARRTTTRDGAYGSQNAFVRPLERVQRVMYQALQGTRQTFWLKRRPIWFGTDSIDQREASSARRDYHMSFSFLRGTVDWEAMLLRAADWEYDRKQGLDKQSTRFRVQYHYGTSGFGELMNRETNATRGDAPCRSFEDSLSNLAGGYRLLRWSHEDVQGFSLVSSLESLSLSPELEKIVEELKHWHSSQEWFQKHGVPWRRGVLFHGPPGTGKTSLARALAEYLDLPVHVFDLAGMSNQDLKRAWRDMLTTSPCMALLEDIDAVFEGNTNKAGKDMMGGGGLTFDTLLNCIDGIERVDGMLLVMTTNNIDAIHDALKDRPGRIDRTVKFAVLDQHGRTKMALRILEDEALAERMAKDYYQDTGARFQERCFQEALRRRFEEPALALVKSDKPS